MQFATLTIAALEKHCTNERFCNSIFRILRRSHFGIGYPILAVRLIFHSERRALLRPAFSPVIEPGCRNIGITEPLLNSSDISTVFQCINRCY